VSRSSSLEAASKQFYEDDAKTAPITVQTGPGEPHMSGRAVAVEEGVLAYFPMGTDYAEYLVNRLRAKHEQAKVEAGK
jgi:hypothetical protein